MLRFVYPKTRNLLAAMFVAATALCPAAESALIRLSTGSSNYATSQASVDADTTSVLVRVPSTAYVASKTGITSSTLFLGRDAYLSDTRDNITGIVGAVAGGANSWGIASLATGASGKAGYFNGVGIGVEGVSSSGTAVYANGATVLGANSGDSTTVNGDTINLPNIPSGNIDRIIGRKTGADDAVTTTDISRFIGGPFLKLDKSNAPLTGTAPLTNEGAYQTTGGDARPITATDLQVFRSASAQVASGDYSVIAGGAENTASGDNSFVGGGATNVASAQGGSVSGGASNTASAQYSSILGGVANLAGGDYSAVLGGVSNTASGNYSLAAGRRAQATATGSMAFADSTNADYTNATADSMAIRMLNGVLINADGTSIYGLNSIAGGATSTGVRGEGATAGGYFTSGTGIGVDTSGASIGVRGAAGFAGFGLVGTSSAAGQGGIIYGLRVGTTATGTSGNGNLIVEGNTTLGDASGDSVTINAATITEVNTPSGVANRLLGLNSSNNHVTTTSLGSFLPSNLVTTDAPAEQTIDNGIASLATITQWSPFTAGTANNDIAVGSWELEENEYVFAYFPWLTEGTIITHVRLRADIGGDSLVKVNFVSMTECAGWGDLSENEVGGEGCAEYSVELSSPITVQANTTYAVRAIGITAVPSTAYMVGLTLTKRPL